MSDEKWVTLTPEQVEALEQGVIVRAHRGDTTVQGPLEGLVGEYDPDVWVGDIRVKSPERIAVREQDVPELDPQRLVSVRADDLADVLHASEVLPLPVYGRLHSALRGETR